MFGFVSIMDTSKRSSSLEDWDNVVINFKRLRSVYLDIGAAFNLTDRFAPWHFLLRNNFRWAYLVVKDLHRDTSSQIDAFNLFSCQSFPPVGFDKFVLYLRVFSRITASFLHNALSRHVDDTVEFRLGNRICEIVHADMVLVSTIVQTIEQVFYLSVVELSKHGMRFAIS